jgi:hypothetical protein
LVLALRFLPLNIVLGWRRLAVSVFIWMGTYASTVLLHIRFLFLNIWLALRLY